MACASLKDFLLELFKDYEANRQILEQKWRKNWTAYKMVPGLELDQKIGLGNKNSEEDKNDWRSKTVADITRVKVTAGKILVSDVLLANGEIPMMLKENKHIGDVVSAVMEKTYQDQNSSRINENVIQMTNLIREQTKRGDADKILQNAILSAAVYGEGISRAVTDTFRFKSFEPSQDGAIWKNRIIEDDGLRLVSVSVWDFFTELENRDIQRNSGLFHRSMMSRIDVLEKFRSDEMTIQENLDKIKLKRNDAESYGDSSSNEAPAIKLINKRKKDLKVLEFWGRAPENLIRDFEAGNNLRIDEDESENERQTEIMAIIVEDEIIKFSRVDELSRPFFRVCWEEGIDDIAGQSIADNIAIMQESLNSFMRCFEDNKKLSANIILAVKKSMIETQSDDNALVPGKTINITEAAKTASEAIHSITIPDVGRSLTDGIQMYEERGNNNSMIPEIAYGVAPAGTSTATEVQTRNEKAGKYIADIIKNFDSDWIEPVGKFFYDWNMLDERVPPSFKGVYDVQPLGFHSYQDKILRMNRIRDMLNMALATPDLLKKLNLNALLGEWMKANELDPDTFLLNDDLSTDPRFEELIQMLDERIAPIEQSVQQVMQELPSISMASELDAQKKQAEIKKIEAEAGKIEGETLNAEDKARNERAKTISEIEKNNHAKSEKV